MKKILIVVMLSLILFSCDSNDKRNINEFATSQIDSSKINKASFIYLDKFSIHPPINWERINSRYEKKNIYLSQSKFLQKNLTINTLDLFSKNQSRNIMSVSIIESDSSNNLLDNYLDLTKRKFRNELKKIDSFTKKGKKIFFVEIRKENLMSLRFLFLLSEKNLFQIEYTFEPDDFDYLNDYVKSSISSIKFL